MPISVATPTSRSVGAPLRAIVRATLAREGRRAGEIAIVLADDARLRELNRAWRGIDRATDVLSFTYDDAPAARAPVSGDLVISLDRVRDQARRFRVTPGAELARLVVHGTLHLAGFDHARAAERADMRDREERVLARCRAAARALDHGLRRAGRRA